MEELEEFSIMDNKNFSNATQEVMDLNRFYFEDEETLDHRCGEIFKTTKGRIIFVCQLSSNCQETHVDLNSFLIHLEKHIPTSYEFDIKEIDIAEEITEESENRTETELVSKPEEEPLTLSETLENYFQEELRDFKKELNELSISTQNESYNFLHGDKIIIHQSRLNIEQKTHNENQERKTIIKKEKEPSPELTIPTEIREIVKRKLYKPPTIADEERKHKCPVCNMGFKDKGNMKHHFKRHTDERNHACTECGKRFYSSTELNTHITRMHIKEKKILCTVCGQFFLTKSELGTHFKRHENKRDYTCHVCKKSFFNAQGLNEHVRSHSADRPFACNMCDASFKRMIALKNHVKLHENKKEYKCELCEAGFNQRAGLFSHMKTAHKLASK